ncbi:hypothetical protein [Mycolicibacterium fortuitum]
MTSDYEQILAVHRGWYESNVGLDAEKMLQFFPCGDSYHQFNLNGWTYSGVLDKHELWINLNKSGFDITMQRDVVGPDVQIFGDVALVTAEGVVELCSSRRRRHTGTSDHRTVPDNRVPAPG